MNGDTLSVVYDGQTGKWSIVDHAYKFQTIVSFDSVHEAQIELYILRKRLEAMSLLTPAVAWSWT